MGGTPMLPYVFFGTSLSWHTNAIIIQLSLERGPGEAALQEE